MDFDAKEIFNYLWFIFMGLWGGTVSYLERVAKEGNHNYLRLLVEWLTSAFTAIITAYACKHLDFSFAATSALTGIAGHMGGRALFIVEKIIRAKVDRYCDNRGKNND